MSDKINKKFICVRCPRGCEIDTTLDGNTIEEIKGNVCKLGAEYVKDEVTNPRRIVTTTVRVKNGKHPLVPVWTESAIPKDKIFDLMKQLNKIELIAPVKTDQIVIKNVFNLNINVITSGKVDCIKKCK
jgi:CxxC motif-containing protein